MTKWQKVWLSIGIAMFAIPEILWSPVVNFYYQFIKGMSVSNVPLLRNNFLENPDNFFVLKLVIVMQLMGLLIIFVDLIKIRFNIYSKWAILVFVIFLVALLSFLVYFAFKNHYGIGF